MTGRVYSFTLVRNLSLTMAPSMYVPSTFSENDLPTLHDFMERHSFATLVSREGSEPFASHLPLLLDRGRGPQGTLIGHMAKANPQWRQADGQTVLAIFHGPHAYISPTWYEATNVVPTWNYIAVHATGTLQRFTDPERLLEIVRQTVDLYEASLPEPWSLEHTDPEFIRNLLGGIVGFEIVIDRIEGKWKLNQNHDEARRKRVIAALEKTGGEDHLQIAAAMQRTRQ